MNSYPPYRITNEMLILTSGISRKIQRVADTHLLTNKPHLRRNNRIQSIHSSLAIEANSLSLNQVTEVINGRTVLGPPKEIREVKNAYDAYEQLPSINPYRIEDLLRLHGIMTGGQHEAKL